MANIRGHIASNLYMMLHKMLQYGIGSIKQVEVSLW